MVMANLQHEVRLLEENNMFEQTVLRGSLVTEELHPSSDIDAIMRSMMAPPPPAHPSVESFQSSRSFSPPSIPQNDTSMTFDDFEIEPTAAIASTPAASRLRPRNKGKARRT